MNGIIRSSVKGDELDGGSSMSIRIFFFLTGFGLAVIGGINMIAYINLLATGYSLIEYLLFIKGRAECYLFPMGFLIICISIYFRGKEKYE